MSKVSRSGDPLVGEASPYKRPRMSNSSSPLIPPLSIHLSPPHLDESTAQQGSPYAFPLLSSSPDHLGVASPELMSPELSVCLPVPSKPDKVPALCGQPTITTTTTTSTTTATLAVQSDPRHVRRNLDGHQSMEVDDETLTGGQQQSDRSPGVRDHGLDLKEGEGTGRNRREMDDAEKERQMTSDGDMPQATKQPEFCNSRSDRGWTEKEKGRDESATFSRAVTGYLTMGARSADCMLQGVVPAVVPPPQPGGALNSCFPSSDGNWYQIISASLPPLLSTPSLPPEKAGTKTLHSGNSSSPNTHCERNPAAIPNTAPYPHPLSLFPTLSLPTTAVTTASTISTPSASLVAPLSTPSPSVDPLLSLLQQYTSGAACGSDLHPTLSALHLPLNLAAAAAAAAAASGGPPPSTPQVTTPHYLYTTNPRTGQLLILSSVGELTAGAGVQHHLQLQPHLPLQPVIQLQPQSMKLVDKAWQASPLRAKQCPPTNSNPPPPSSAASSASPPTSTPSLPGGKNTAKPISVVSKLLQSTLSCGLKHDENTPSVAAARNLLALATTAQTQGATGPNGVLSPLRRKSMDVKPGEEPVRENHNMKERRRRARIKDACDLMRQLVPGMSEKTDKATVFEFSARYIHFLKNMVGTHHDKDFLIKYSPY